MFHFKPLLIAAISWTLIGAPAFAQDVSIIKTEIPLKAEASTHPPLRLTPDKSELVRLPRGAASVIVGNPAHISVLAENANTLVIVPLAPGASHFTALDNKGNVIIQQHVIVASPQRDYVRVRRTCSRGDDSCQATSVYYCPDMCHEIAMTSSDSQPAAGQATDSNAAANNGFSASPAPSADTP